MKRGTYAGFLPLAIMGGAMLAKALLKKKGATSAAKEQNRANDANLQAQYESSLAGETNREDDRLMRTQGIANQLQGARALSPEVIAAVLKRRAVTSRKGVSADQSKGLGWNMLGDIAGTAGDFAGSYIKGGMMDKAGMGSGLTNVIGAPQPSSNGECPGGYPAVNGKC